VGDLRREATTQLISLQNLCLQEQKVAKTKPKKITPMREIPNH
jgi:hypothetical protein